MKTLKVMMLALLFAGASYADSKGDLLVTTVMNKGGTADVVFELLNEGGIVGVQFEVTFGEKFSADKAKIDGCVGFSSDGLSGCNFVNKALRVAVLDGGLQDLNTGEIGRITVPASAIGQISVRNLKFVDAKGTEQDVQALMDVSGGQSGLFEK